MLYSRVSLVFCFIRSSVYITQCVCVVPIQGTLTPGPAFEQCQPQALGTPLLLKVSSDLVETESRGVNIFYYSQVSNMEF